MPYQNDNEFMAYVGHLIEKPSVQRLKSIPPVSYTHLTHDKNLSFYRN